MNIQARHLSPLILGLDISDINRAMELSRQVREYVDVVKVGLELFSAEGPEAVRKLREEGFEVFLDLKMNDIPNTVSRALRVLAELHPLMISIHTIGGKEMLDASLDTLRSWEARNSSRRPMLVGVTVLTSLDDFSLKEIGIRDSAEEEVSRLANMACRSSLDGLVVSPLEVSRVRREVGDEMTLITPGVRPAGSLSGDQKRTATPEEAISWGADFLVVGRPITEARNPHKAARDIFFEVKNTRSG
ncbi:MAG: orotidine-5'-phosphate decarboxylase [Actinomycetota bacterium]|nr:orotidine-5'-phosphate decarboxylase [Actinomycetota bacterium]